MNGRVDPARLALFGGLLLGAAGDVLLRARGPLGVNLSLWVAAIAVAVFVLHRRAGTAMGREAAAWLIVAVAFAAAVAWRGSDSLKLLAFACAASALALPALRSGAAWVRSGGVSEYLGALGAAGVNAATGAALTLRDVDWNALMDETRGEGRGRQALAVGRGVVLALPLLVVFGALFVSADAVFARLVAETLHINVETLITHLLLLGFFSWIAMGYLHGSLTRRGLPAVESFAKVRPALGITETAVVIGLLNLLFLLFVILQFRYLFGGSTLIEVTPGLTYAEYARRGFFELVAAVALVLPFLLAADTLLRRERPRDERVFRALAGLQVLLVMAIMASAFERMRAYQEAYGLTEQRVYVTAVLILIGVVLFWFAATVLRGRRRHFAFGALVAALATVAVLHVVNPDALIARTNVARAVSATAGTGVPEQVRFDVQHATTLGADAVPILVASLPTLPEDARSPVACRLLRRWPPDESVPLRSWNWSDRRARRAVQEQADWLGELAGVECKR